MNTDNELNPINQVVLDRLVDGDLSPTQERALLAGLDRTPDGWRRCALTFMESRVWKQELRSLVQHDRVDAPTIGTGGAGRRTNHWTWALAMAAVFLLAVSIGQLIPPWWSSTTGTSDAPLAKSPSTAPLLAANEPANGPVKLDHLTGAPDGGQPVGNLMLVDDNGRQLKVPVFDWDRQLADSVLFQPEPLPAELVRNLKRHEVRRHQRYVPIQLKDGRRVVVPVQELDIVPVSGTAY